MEKRARVNLIERNRDDGQSRNASLSDALLNDFHFDANKVEILLDNDWEAA